MNSHKNLVTASVIGLVSVLLVFVAILPIYQHERKLLKQIELKSSELESLSNRVSVLSRLDPNILEERVETLDRALPPKKDVLQYLASIDGLSRELGLTFGGLTLSPGDITEASTSADKKTVKLAGLQSLETEIKMRGTEENVYSFLQAVEEVLPLMQIRNIKVSILSQDQYGLALILGMLWAEPATADVKSQVTLFGETEERYFAQLSQYRRFDSVINSTEGMTGKTDLFAPFNLDQQ